jgi:hypothetical protein
MNKKSEASMSVLMMSIASSAAMSMGLSPHPETGKLDKNKEMARFNIDLLLVLKEKTKGNLTKEEESFLNSVLQDLQMRFVELQ